MFAISARDPASAARLGAFPTKHGVIETPCFMPVGTRGAVKGVAFDWLEAWGCRVVLANASDAMIGMAGGARSEESPSAPHSALGTPHSEKPLVGATMFGVTTPCVEAARRIGRPRAKEKPDGRVPSPAIAREG